VVIGLVVETGVQGVHREDEKVAHAVLGSQPATTELLPQGGRIVRDLPVPGPLAGSAVFLGVRIVLAIGIHIPLPIFPLDVIKRVRVLEDDQATEPMVDIAEGRPGREEVGGSPIHEHAVAMGRGSESGGDRAQPDVVEMADGAVQVPFEEGDHRAIEEQLLDLGRLAREVRAETDPHLRFQGAVEQIGTIEEGAFDGNAFEDGAASGDDLVPVEISAKEEVAIGGHAAAQRCDVVDQGRRIAERSKGARRRRKRDAAGPDLNRILNCHCHSPPVTHRWVDGRWREHISMRRFWKWRSRIQVLPDSPLCVQRSLKKGGQQNRPDAG
jgi:hypothetical protein